jgi:general secretion pathway protein B
MSYILDALKKSDQQRQHGATPTLRSVPIATQPEKSASWIYVALAIVLAAAGVVIGWLRPWQPEPVIPAAQAISVQSSESSSRQTPLTTTSALPAMAETPVMPKLEPLTQRLSPVTLPGTVPKIALPSIANKPDSTQPVEAAAEQGNVITMEELPLPVRQELPPMTISLHAYSHKSEDSLVSINNQLLHEGGSPASGVTLEKITADGMILSYRGYRFQRGVQ